MLIGRETFVKKFNWIRRTGLHRLGLDFGVRCPSPLSSFLVLVWMSFGGSSLFYRSVQCRGPSQVEVWFQEFISSSSIVYLRISDKGLLTKFLLICFIICTHRKYSPTLVCNVRPAITSIPSIYSGIGLWTLHIRGGGSYPVWQTEISNSSVAHTTFPGALPTLRVKFVFFSNHKHWSPWVGDLCHPWLRNYMKRAAVNISYPFSQCLTSPRKVTTIRSGSRYFCFSWQDQQTKGTLSSDPAGDDLWKPRGGENEGG